MARRTVRSLLPLVRKSSLDALPKDNKAVLLSIKASMAFAFAFMNGVCFNLTSRFFNLMTGNTLILAAETAHWKTTEMLLTATLIILFVCGGGAYDAAFYKYDDEKVVKLFVMPICIILGVISDEIQYALGSCSAGIQGDKCSGKYLYFLAPMAFAAGIMTSYLNQHPDGIVTNMVTGHMKSFPRKVRVCVVFYHMNSIVLYDVSVILLLHLNLVCLYIFDHLYKPHVLTKVTISSLHLHKL